MDETRSNASVLLRKKSLGAGSLGGGTSGGCTTPVVLPWDRFSYWVHSILVVTFDIEMGQSIESVYPAGNHTKLSANDKTNICYMSFPDSNSGVLGDTQFHFRFKQDSSANATMTTNSTVSANLNNLVLSSPSTATWSVNTSSQPFNYDDFNRRTLPGFEIDRSYMFGYVFFRQVKDKSLKRGYFQKSVVLLSRFPFVSLFNYILSLIAVEFFSTGAEVIETACHDIDKWPFPTPGEVISMPILGHLIEICLPIKFDKYILPVIYKKEYPNVPVTLPPAHEVNLYKCLQPIILHIHLVWELILLNEPILVIANVPSMCSELVQALISTIWPLKYASDYRPFFTIHNTEFSEYSSKTTLPPGLVIGVTNPFFTKCLQHWPNIIKIGDLSKTSSRVLDNSNESLDDLKSGSTSSKVKKTTSIKDVDSKPVVYTNMKSFLKRDKVLLKSLIRGAEANRPFEAQSAILRRHFMDLTQSFMIPLERYFSGLLPLHKNISPFKSVPKLKDFDSEDFLKNLKQAGPELAPRLKGDWIGLYKRFFDSLNFAYWLDQKKLEAERKLEQLQIELLAGCDINKWLQGKQEIEIIDQFINVKNKLELVTSCKIEVNEQIKLKLRSILDTFLRALPDDVQQILNKNISHNANL